jgi:hypothetical protein
LYDISLIGLKIISIGTYPYGGTTPVSGFTVKEPS